MTKSEPPTGERPTLKTIAFMNGLGVSTVSQALKDGHDISRAIKLRVQFVAKQIDYRPNRAGVRLRTGKTNVIALVLNTKEEGIGLVSEMVYGILEVLSSTSYHLVETPYSLPDPMEPIRYIVETGSADGIILSRTQPDDPRVRYLLEHAMPFATHGRTAMDVVHPNHDLNNQAFAFEAVRIIAERGHQKVALVGPPQGLIFQKHTRTGFEMGLRGFGLNEHWLSDIDIDSPAVEIVARGVELGHPEDRPEGIVCSSAISAIALSAGLINAGLKIGQDIDLVTEQSTQLMELLRPEIIFYTRIFAPPATIMRAR
jgi:LacI family transcriptional regulator